MTEFHRAESEGNRGTRSETQLPHKQREALEVIKEFWQHHRMPPTRLNVARAMHLNSVSSVEAHIQALHRKGFILIVGGNRGIRLVNPPELPLVNEADLVRDDKTRLSADRITNWIPKILAGVFSPAPDCFVLLGEKNAARLNIGAEEVVAVKAAKEAQEGEIVLAWIDEKLTCGRFHPAEKFKVEIHSLNPGVARAIRRVHLHQRDFAIEGTVAGVLRGENFPVSQRRD